MSYILNPYRYPSFVSNFLFDLQVKNASRHLIGVEGTSQLDGNGAVDLNGTSDHLTVPYDADWQVTGDYCMEVYIKADALGGSDDFIIDQQSTSSGIRIDLEADDRIYAPWYFTGSPLGRVDLYSSPITDNNWHHVASTLEGTTARLFVDGSLQSTDTVVGSFATNTNNLWIGRYTAGDPRGFDGKLSRLHISKGTARYTSNFTPPIRTDDIVVDQYTVLALNFNGTSGSQRIFDSARPSDGAEVPFIPDTSGNEHDVSNAVVGDRPAFVDATNSMVNNGNTGSGLLNSTLVQAQPFTLYLVGTANPDSVATTLLGDTTAYMSTKATTRHFEANAGTSVTDTTDRSGVKTLFAAEFNGANSKLYINGTQVAAGDVGAGSLSGFGLGIKSDGTDPLNGTIYAAFAKSGPWEAQTDSYIRNEYGL